MVTNNVELVLEHRGISQRWLATQLAISESYLSRLMSGDRGWTDELRSKTARLLQTPSALLFPYDCVLRPQSVKSEATP